MRKINYRITVNITQKTMKLGFRAKMPEEMEGKRIRVQAVFTQRQVERRFPMEVVIEEGEVGEQIAPMQRFFCHMYFTVRHAIR